MSTIHIAYGRGPTLLSCPFGKVRRARGNSSKQTTAKKELSEAETLQEEGCQASTSLTTPLRYPEVCVQTQYFFELSRSSERAEGRLRATDAIPNASFIWSPWESVKPGALLGGSPSLVARWLCI